jgi:putative transposase
VNLSYQFRAYPTPAQAAALEVHLSEAARLYNGGLQERRDAWKMRGERITYISQCNQLREIRAAGDIGIANFTVAQGILRRLDHAFAAFFRRVKAGEAPGYPRFRSARRYDSIAFRVGNGAVLKAGHVRLHGIGDVRFKMHRPTAGVPKYVTAKREAGRWFVIVACECDPVALPPCRAVVGIDVGLTDFATFSDGTAVPNPRHERQAARRVRVARRALARKTRGSNRRQKAAQRLQRALGKVRRQRADFHHKLAREIVNDHGLIAVEDLNVKGLAGGMLARSVHGAGWTSFIEKLTYKAESAGRTLVKVDPRGTSQTCPCGQAVPKNLSQRRHDCPACGMSTSRDHAAALNILQRGSRCQAPSVAVAALA